MDIFLMFGLPGLCGGLSSDLSDLRLPEPEPEPEKDSTCRFGAESLGYHLLAIGVLRVDKHQLCVILTLKLQPLSQLFQLLPHSNVALTAILS